MVKVVLMYIARLIEDVKTILEKILFCFERPPKKDEIGIKVS